MNARKRVGRVNKHLLPVYHRLYAHYGPQHWWPGETPFEVMVGAILTQNTAWSNVERAIANLKQNRLLDPLAVVTAPRNVIAGHLKPAGYFNVKTARLRNFCDWYLRNGGYARLSRWTTAALRRSLLAVNGIGPETADDILLYAFHRDVFVIDAYTRRVFSRLGVVNGDEDYDDLRGRFESGIRNQRGGGKRDTVRIFNEYHALIVVHGKDVCRALPRCGSCCLNSRCPTAGA